MRKMPANKKAAKKSKERVRAKRAPTDELNYLSLFIARFYKEDITTKILDRKFDLYSCKI
jgi:hypothetical protein